MDIEPVELTCPECGDEFIGWPRDQGSVCFDCYACKYFKDETREQQQCES